MSRTLFDETEVPDDTPVRQESDGLHALTAAEIAERDADATAHAAARANDADPDVIAERALVAEFEFSAIRRLLFEIEFDQEARLRVIEGKPAITKAQYRDASLALLKTL